EDGIRDFHVTGVQTCALPIWHRACGEALLGAHLRQLAAESKKYYCLLCPPRSRGETPRHGHRDRREARLRSEEAPLHLQRRARRSEERRVGKEWRSERTPKDK